jgi:hypothetical protein
VQILGSTFRIGVAGDAVPSLQDWVSCFDVDALVRRDDLRMTDRAILRTARARPLLIYHRSEIMLFN